MLGKSLKSLIETSRYFNLSENHFHARLNLRETFKLTQQHGNNTICQDSVVSLANKLKKKVCKNFP